MKRMLFVLPLVCLFLLNGQTASATTCLTASTDCTEWVTLAGRPPRLLVYRSYPLDGRNESITRALIVVHGGGRDADNNFRTALAAAFLAGAVDNTVVISPRFASNSGRQAGNGGECRDRLASDEANWVCDVEHPDSWRYGGVAIGTDKLSSYDLVDEILRKLARKHVFPNLRAIVVTGHSGGGMFSLRYAMTNQVHDKLGVAVRYVPSNSTNYPYLDSTRPTANAYPVHAAAPGYIPATPAQLASFSPFADSRGCTAYNDWPYGLQKRTGYAARLADEELKRQLASRPVTYLLGQLDLVPLNGDDLSCSAFAQGPTRLARGLAFRKYVNEKFGAKHDAIVVNGCGHNGRCTYTAEQALALIFPK